MAAITFTGLESGFDSGALIDQLVAAEKIPEQAINDKKYNTTQQVSTLGGIVSQLQSLGSIASSLQAAGGAQPMSVTSGDSTRVTAVASATAQTGSYQMTVNSLAQAQSSVSAGYASNTAGIAGVGSLSITVGTSPAVTVNYGTTDTLDTIASSMNAQAGGKYIASVVYDGNKWHIVINASAPGVSNAPSFSQTGSGLGLTTLQPAGDASITINGLTVTRPSNSISDVIPGVTFSLQSQTPTGGSPTVVTVQPDNSALRDKMQSLVDAYNAVIGTVNGQLSYNGVKRGPETLFGDPALQGLQRDIGTLFANSYSFGGTAPISGGDLGVSLANDGTLTFDTAKFDAAIAADPSAAQHLLNGDGTSTGAGGLAKALGAIVATYADSSKGILTLEQTSRSSNMDGYDKQIQAIENRATAVGDSLRQQFARLDQLMTDFKTQQSYITAMTSQNNANNG